MSTKATVKKIFYSHAGPVHTYIKTLMANPPKGYVFSQSPHQSNNSIQKMSKNKFLKWMYKKVVKNTFNVFPLILKAYRPEIPADADLILSTGAVIEEKKPWLLILLDSPFAMGGNDYYVFKRNLPRITNALLSPYCKQIIVHTTHSLKIMKHFFSEEILRKTTLVRPAIPAPKKAPVKKRADHLRLLFLGSITNPDEFNMKGGLEALRVTKELADKGYPVELVVRCKVPEEIKEMYQQPYIRYIEAFVSEKELEKLYEDTDMLIMPGYGGYMIMAYFESLSKGIPIAALDAFGVSDFVVDGKNGFYVPCSQKAPVESEQYPVNTRSAQFSKIIKEGDPVVTRALALKISSLFNDRTLLKRLQKNAYMLFITTCSMRDQNAMLKKIFDEATHEK